MISLGDLKPPLIQELLAELNAVWLDLAAARSRLAGGQDIKAFATRTCNHLARIYELIDVPIPT